jgi:drug/metabolite transporter, DME family
MTSVGPRAGRSARRSELTGLALVAAAAVLWGLLGPVARIPLREGVGPLEIGFWRALLAGALCWAVGRGRSARIAREDLAGVFGFGLVGVALFYAAYFLAVQEAGAALAAVLLYTAPAWVALASYAWLRDRVTRRTAGAVVLTLLGVAGISLAGGEIGRPSLLGIVWGLLAGLCYASYYLVGRRYFARYGTLPVLAYALPVGALALLPWVSLHPRSGAAWLSILFIAAVPTFAAYLVYGAGVVRVQPTRAATVATIEPLVAAVVAFAAWGERFPPAGYLGAVLVLGAVLLSATAEPPPPRVEVRR